MLRAFLDKRRKIPVADKSPEIKTANRPPGEASFEFGTSLQVALWHSGQRQQKTTRPPCRRIFDSCKPPAIPGVLNPKKLATKFARFPKGRKRKGRYGNEIAPVGQTSTHAPQSAQVLSSTFALPSTISIAPVGQACLQSPHPLHFVVSTTAGILVQPPFAPN